MPSTPTASSEPLRCMAVVGTVYTGPRYCGYSTTATDGNGRPCCKRHLDHQLGIEWFGDRRNYPHGTRGRWRFSNGEESTPPARPKRSN